MASNAEVVRDLVRAKVAFQLRTIETILTAAPPSCRWCREPVRPNTPCDCDRAQTELARIRAGTER